MKLLVAINYLKASMEMSLKPLVHCDKVDKIYVVHDREVPDLPKVEYHSTPKYLYSFLPGILQGVARNLMMLLVMVRLSITQKPDIIISFNIGHSYLAFICGRLFRKPAIACIDDAPRMWRLRRMLIPVLKGCDLILVTGPQNRDDLIAMGVSRDKITILPNTIDIDRFKPVPTAKLYDVITVGRLAPAKKMDTLLKIVSKLKEQKSDIKAGIVGDGPLRASLQKLADELGIVDNVAFLGWQENTEFYYNSAKVFVLTSYYEGLPRSVIEAMACGLPCVVSNVGDISHIAAHETNAMVVDDPYDVDAFVNAILRLLEDEELYARLSKSSQLIRNQYGYPAATRVWDEIIDLIGGKSSKLKDKSD